MRYAPLAVVVVGVAAFGGYVANIVKLAGLVLHHAPVDAMLLGRALGVIAGPLGAVLGYF